ncbi:fimbria/pilus periplasmic chaperone [Candidatus Pantoea formicae]|uniref:fimbria/pilus periplasmic chaperone n=1 Tax=Candidatus Pantoea formicae TaxID=2608355 RepID=UPI003EDB55FB
MALFLTSSLSYADAQNISTELQNFSVKTGATRLIYSAGTSGATLTVMNPQSYPMLVQSEVVGEDGKSKAPFIVTPPLFRLDGHQQSRIKVVATSNHDMDTKESLYWLCLTGIPPEPDSEWADAEFKKKNAGHTATLLTQLRIKTCLKLLMRPSSLKGTPDDFASSLTWKKNGKVLTVNNPTPFFINLKSVRLGTENIASLNYIPPMGTLQLDASPEARGPVHWRLITDYGGDSREFISDLN